MAFFIPSTKYKATISLAEIDESLSDRGKPNDDGNLDNIVLYPRLFSICFSTPPSCLSYGPGFCYGEVFRLFKLNLTSRKIGETIPHLRDD